MESKESCWEDRVESLLDQLLKFTAQLTELENDPQINAKALSGACIRRLNELKTLMPQNPKSSLASENEVLEKMRAFMPAPKSASISWEGRTTGWPMSSRLYPGQSTPSTPTLLFEAAPGEKILDFKICNRKSAIMLTRSSSVSDRTIF